MPCLYVALSPHGYGHATMTIPVLNQLREHVPNLHLIIETNIPRIWLTSRLHGPFKHVSTRDFGMIMRSATEVDVERTHAAYLKLHANWLFLVKEEAEKLHSFKPDVLLSNISYLAIAGASCSGIPSLALCSLNWADVYHTYCNTHLGSNKVLSQMKAAYRAAQVFLRVLPAMSMERIHHHIQDIGPIVFKGHNKHSEICHFLHISEETNIGLLAFGGINPALALNQWPRHPKWLWIVGLKKAPYRCDMVQASALPLSFIDLLFSVDAILTKPGYGISTEVAYTRASVLYSCRGNWPETPSLTQWLKAYTRSIAVPTERLWTGDFTDELIAVQNLPHPNPPPQPTGTKQATSIILDLF